ncbi:peptidoglycan DD-metalloendopeptidase family protein [Nocardia sp. NRRL S-836]|uniref:peptidoglycan DD-metalloendopeptidase family protein n=1 Tax=Nocardia sp. NRRL S-836 TaxID=1519492 RepID=UPI0018D0A88C|nr:peptidoglycan DD-metalloendopeptidase family protein [Nocardia sp. NRRL S-836]
MALAAAATALAAASLTALTATPAAAAARDGVCDSGEFCYFYNSDRAGSISDFAGSVPDYGSTQPSCYDFKSAGAGQGLCVKNNAASVWNRTGGTVRVYYNSGYAGASQDFAAGAKTNLNSTLKNNNASHQFNPGTTGRFWLPFPCGETWEASTRSNHSPANAVDLNHYPEDNGYKVYSSAPGTVSKVANLGSTSYGRYIVIDHAGGWQTLYAHLSSQDVSVGQSVSEKTMIGRVGNTGGSTGPHLHYEQKLNGSVQRVTFRDGNPTYWGTRNLARSTNCP